MSQFNFSAKTWLTAVFGWLNKLRSKKERANDPLNVKATLKSGNDIFHYWSLDALEKAGFGDIARLPKSQKVLLESVLRRYDGTIVTAEHIRALSTAYCGEKTEIPFLPARVVLQDFTGVPLFVDLAAMRDAMHELGGDPALINPIIPCDLVIDHSVQVDHFGSHDALALNEQMEFERNQERYRFLKWAQSAFTRVRLVPSSTGIVHQVNLEYLASLVFLNESNEIYADTCIGTDSHTPMVNGLGVLAWGVGGIEAEAAMLGQPMSLLIPEVVGIKLTGSLPSGTTATDLVLRITELCREFGVVGKFVEFFGPGVQTLSTATRATVSNMAPEQGATVSFFPIDEETLRYLAATGRSQQHIALVRAYAQAQGLWVDDNTPEPEFSSVITLDLSTVTPCVAGPKRPQDRIELPNVGREFLSMLTESAGASRGFGLSAEANRCEVQITRQGESNTVDHGMVAIAAITSCTNTSNPSVMLAAGLLAKKAVELGLRVPSYVKTSLAPGSRVVEAYLRSSGLLPYLEQLGFHIVGYGCTTCIGNSGPLPKEVAEAIEEHGLVAAAVISGNRNFEGRIHPLVQANFLASPPLVVAYALLGTTAKDITTQSFGEDHNGNSVYLAQLWPSDEEISAAIRDCISPAMYTQRYSESLAGSRKWQELAFPQGILYQWDANSTYIQRPPFLQNLETANRDTGIRKARVLGLFGDSVTTDHISPAGSIQSGSPAGEYLMLHNVSPAEFNSYGSRRGNDRVMSRGTFSNVRIRNKLTPGEVGNVTLHHPSGQRMTFFDASNLYRAENTPLIIIAGKLYGNGSSRDWASKGPNLLGVQAIIFETCERIHRSNLVGMGILPLQFMEGENSESLGIKGDEEFSIIVPQDVVPQQTLPVEMRRADGSRTQFQVVCRIDTPLEARYYRDGGILRTVLKQLL